MTAAPKFRVFISTVSSEFEKARSSVASDLRARGIEVKVQEDFRQEADADTTLRLLHNYIRDCSAVACIIGGRSGDVPPSAAVEPFKHMLPPGIGRASYTQWEFFFARHFHKRLSLYLANNDYLPDKDKATGKDFLDLQSRFVAYLLEGQGLNRAHFSTSDQLRWQVLREDWPQTPHTKPRNLPYHSLDTLFKGRDEFLTKLRDSLKRAADGRATAIVGKALHGLGGVGKTRLAVEYAWRNEDDYSALLFVTADTPANFHANLANLVGPLVLNLPEQEAQENEVKLKAVLDWLRSHPGWFLIVDNVDTPEAALAVQDLLKNLHGGQVLITSRLSHWKGLVKPLELDVLSPADAAAYLLEATQPPNADPGRKKTPADAADAAQLAKTLGGLALALEQAGAYIAEMRVSFTDYLQSWNAHDQAVQAWHDPLVMQYPRSVASTWQTTIDQLGAGEFALLRLLAWFAPDPLPLSVLEGEEAREIGQRTAQLLRPELPVIKAGATTLLEATRLLARFNMAKWDADASTITVHRVVQEILRNRTPEATQKAWIESSLNLLNNAFTGDPTDVRTWPVLNPLAAHAAEVARHADEANINHPTVRLMNYVGLLYMNQVRFSEAEALLRRAIVNHEKFYGREHLGVVGSLDNLAQLLAATNRLAEAEPLMRRALAIAEQYFGKVHPNFVRDFNNLPQLLPDVRVVFFITPAELARNLNNLALLLQDTNRLAEAEPLMRQALAIDEQFFGKEHPTVARDLDNLAQMLQATNRLADAEPLMRRALTIIEQFFGEEHPRIALGLNNLAQLLRATNRLAEAEPLLLRALAINEQSFGKEHPKVAVVLNNLAGLFQATNRLAEAEPLSRRHLGIFLAFMRRTGHEHPHFKTAQANYASILKAMGRSNIEIKAEIVKLVREHQ